MSAVCKFRLSKNLSDTNPSILVTFSNGCLKLTDSSDIAFSSYVNSSDHDETDTNDRARRIVVASSNRLTYKGASYEDNTTSKPLLRYLIGVRNRETGKMKCYSCIILNLSPIHRKVIPSETSSKAKDMSRGEMLDSLSLNFGNKTKKRAVNARIKYAVESLESSPAIPSPTISDSFENITIREPTSTKKLPKGAISGLDYVPPQNQQAQYPHEVYNICDIISPHDEECLAGIVRNLSSEDSFDIKSWKSQLALCPYVMSHLAGDINEEKLSYLLYFNYMVTFSRLNYSDINKKDPAPSIPEPLKTKLLDTFTTVSVNEKGKHSRNWPPKMKDKLFAYMLVLALIIDDYIVNINLVIEGSKRSLQSAVNVAQALGCHIVQRTINGNTVKFAELKIPLFILPSKRRQNQSSF